MQLNKQNRKAVRAIKEPRHFSLPLANFNPVVKKGIQIVFASTWGNLEEPTHIAITTVRVK